MMMIVVDPNEGKEKGIGIESKYYYAVALGRVWCYSWRFSVCLCLSVCGMT